MLRVTFTKLRLLKNLMIALLVFQDGKEVLENFNISSYTQTKMIKYPSRAKAGERLYLLHASEKKGIYNGQNNQH